MKKLRLFDTHDDYTAYTADTENFIKPNVSYCVSENEVHMSPYVDPANGHPYVEIGGLKWATMNVGATAVTDGGLYFQWGDTVGYTASQVGSGEGKKYFGWNDYKYWTADTGSGSSGLTKYNSTDGKTVLGLDDDAAAVNMGGSWRMPTSGEMETLSAATTNAWVTNYQGSGVNGRLFTDKTDNSKTLFFPAVGDAYNGSLTPVGSYGYVWSSSITTEITNATYLYFGGSTALVTNYYRYYGFSVRGVLDV